MLAGEFFLHGMMMVLMMTMVVV